MPQSANLFIACMPTGLVYCDTSKEQHGDYKKVAYLNYRTLTLEVYAPRSPLLPEIREDAARMQAMAGKRYTVSGSGQFVVLGAE